MAEGSRAFLYLYPGRFLCAREPTVVTTVLGSCVAVCLWDADLRIGGMNHFLLPEGTGGRPSPRFGNVAVSTLVEGMISLGSPVGALKAKLFGGARVLPSSVREGDPNHLGLRNVEIARKILGERAIPIVAEDVGGTSGRKLVYHTDDGAAWIRKL